MSGRRLLAFGVACMVVSSLCDSLRGPALPLLAQRFSAGYGRVSFFLTAGSLGSLAFNLLSLGPLLLFSDRAFIALAAGMQGAALLMAAAAPGLGTLSAAGFVWGAGNTGLGMGANLLAIRGSDERGRARLLAFLHSFYGLSCVVPPLYVAAAARLGWGLAALLAAPAVLPAALALSAGALPAGHGAAESADPRAALSDAPVASAAVIALYVLGEVMTSMWLVALETARGADLGTAGRTLSGFFLALAAGRLATALLARKGAERVFVPLGLAVGAAGTLVGASGARWGFWLAGAAFGPVFPLLMTRLSVERAGRVREALAFVYALMVVALGCGHQAMGWAAQALSPRAAACLPAAFLAGALAVWLGRGERGAADAATRP